MSDFSQNEKKENIEEEILKDFNEEEFSTIFSDPTAHTKTADDIKRKPKWRVIVAAFLAVAIIIGGTVGIAKLIPEKEDEPNPSDNIKSITVLDLTSDDLSEMTVTNSNGTYKFYSEIVASTETDDSSSSGTESKATEKTYWYIEGYDKELTNETNVSAKVTSIAGAVADLEVTKLSVADCGLDNPKAKAEIVTKEGEKIFILIGNTNLDKVSGGSYMKLADSDKIYLVSETYVSEFEFTPLNMAATTSLPHFDPGEEYSKYLNEDKVISTFDSITVSGANFKEPVVIEPSNDEDLAAYLGYVVTSPTKRLAENVDGLFGAFQQGVIVSGVYSFDVSAESLAAHGLDNPDIVATIKIGSSSSTFKFKLQEDGNYAAIEDGGKSIRMITASNVPFGEYTVTDFYSSWVCLNSIEDLKGLSIVTPDKTYDFGITANPDEEAEDKYIVTYGDTEIDCQSFQDFYQQLISISCTDFAVSNVSGNADYSFVFKFKDDIGGENRIDFIKASETRFEYRSDGEALGKVNASALNKIIRELEKLVG